MRKIVSMLISFLFIFGFFGCVRRIYELPHDQFCYSTYQSTDVQLSLEEKRYICDLLNNASWINDNSKCDSDYVFYTQKQAVGYHAECGTFNDYTRKKHAKITEGERIKLNAILSGLIQL